MLRIKQHEQFKFFLPSLHLVSQCPFPIPSSSSLVFFCPATCGLAVRRFAQPGASTALEGKIDSNITLPQSSSTKSREPIDIVTSSASSHIPTGRITVSAKRVELQGVGAAIDADQRRTAEHLAAAAAELGEAAAWSVKHAPAFARAVAEAADALVVSMEVLGC